MFFSLSFLFAFYIYILECMVVFVEQPQPRGMRFRYPCEGHSANRTYPTLQLLKYTVPVPVELMICLVTADQPYKPHPHNLVGKNCRDGIYRVELPPGTREHIFSSVGIQCCKKNDVRNIILKRLSDGIDPFDGKLIVSLVNYNLCVDTSPTLSNAPFCTENTCASILKIIRFNKIAGSVLGDDEVILLCDKVQKGVVQCICPVSLGLNIAKLK
uniref:RHD domain-containing protein n=1 Tax=Eptatretus burgeri TaxID=7764 RepID=A0A8C4PWQ7_EPTBU